MIRNWRYTLLAIGLGFLVFLLMGGCLATTARDPVPPPLQLDQDQPEVEHHEPPEGEVAPLFWLDESPEIDGDFSKWNGMVSAVPRVTVYGGGYNPDVISGEFTVATDGSTFYIFADITDAVPMENPLSPAQAWRSDSVEIYLGTDTGDRRSYLDSDSQIRLVPRSKDDPTEFGLSINDEDRTDRTEAYVEYYDQGYAIEAAVPLDLLGISSLSEGEEVLLEFQINDADRGERERMVQWMSPRDDTHYNPSSWGDGVVVRPEDAEEVE